MPDQTIAPGWTDPPPGEFSRQALPEQMPFTATPKSVEDYAAVRSKVGLIRMLACSAPLIFLAIDLPDWPDPRTSGQRLPALPVMVDVIPFPLVLPIPLGYLINPLFASMVSMGVFGQGALQSRFVEEWLTPIA